MPGSSDYIGERKKQVYGVGGALIGSFPLAHDRDPDPTSQVLYVMIGNYECMAVPHNDGSCQLTNVKDTARALHRRES